MEFRSPAVFAPQPGKARTAAYLAAALAVLRPLRGLEKLIELMKLALAAGPS